MGRLNGSRTLLRRLAIATLIVFVLWNLVDVYHIQHALQLPQHQLATSPRSPRLYIASLHYNNAALLREYWNDAIVELSKTLGPANVFVAAYESGSSDDTKHTLLDLDYRLTKIGVPRSIVLSNKTHGDEIAGASPNDGWVDSLQSTRELRRVPYLARLRNLSLKPLQKLAEAGVMFDRILFLNDVVFQVCTKHRWNGLSSRPPQA